MKVLQSFPSKRNKVYLMEIDGSRCIMKFFNNERDMEKEYSILNYLCRYDLDTPIIFGKKDMSLCMGYIDGNTLLDTIILWEEFERNDYIPFLNRFAQYHGYLYDALDGYKHKTILGDMNFRNYIIKDAHIFRIDYESCTIGGIECDIGKLAAFALTYSPPFTKWKKAFVDNLLNIFSRTFVVQKKKIISEMEKELEAMKARRSK